MSKKRRPQATFKPCKICKTPRPFIHLHGEVMCRSCRHTWSPGPYELIQGRISD